MNFKKSIKQGLIENVFKLKCLLSLNIEKVIKC